jgi:hypothetical protein
MTLELNAEELEVLRDTLASSLGELRVEIVKTDSHRLRDELKERENVLKGLIVRLAALHA